MTDNLLGPAGGADVPAGVFPAGADGTSHLRGPGRPAAGAELALHRARCAYGHWLPVTPTDRWFLIPAARQLPLA
jgi:hypothetical protein